MAKVQISHSYQYVCERRAAVSPVLSVGFTDSVTKVGTRCRKRSDPALCDCGFKQSKEGKVKLTPGDAIVGKIEIV
jgi:hypothetical protein